jgi:RNA polymerase sigma-70 factor, ECF subfamily
MIKMMRNAAMDMTVHLALGELEAQRDERLVSAAKAGSNDAFAELRNLYAQRLYGTIVRITRNHEDAEDVLQNTFLRVYLGLCRFEGRSSFYSWATRIAINSALMVLRKRRARPEVSFDLPSDGTEGVPQFEIEDSSANPEQIYHERQQWVRMLRSIQNLQPRLQGAIQVRMANEGSMKEIAQTLGISVASVKSRLYRARARLYPKRILATGNDKRQVTSRMQRKGHVPSLQNAEVCVRDIGGGQDGTSTGGPPGSGSLSGK